MIRVISGKYKGKSLKRVPSDQVRPMPGKLKGSLFDILQDRVRGSAFLDGFAGTGSVGIEALSRGARVAFFIEQFYPAVKVIRANLARCQADDQARILHKEFNRAIIQLEGEGMTFDLVFLDPPYRLLDERNPLKVLYKRKVLTEDALIILRHHFKTRFESRYFSVERRVALGDDVLVFYVPEKQV